MSTQNEEDYNNDPFQLRRSRSRKQYWLVELWSNSDHRFTVREYGRTGFLDESTGRLYYHSQLNFIEKVDDEVQT